MKNHTIVACIIFLALSALSGCSSVSPATVALSEETSNRITLLRDAHVDSMNQHYDDQIRLVDEFIKSTWAPLFLRNFLQLSGVLQDIKGASIISNTLKNELDQAAKLYLTDPDESIDFVDKLSHKLTSSRQQEAAVVNQVVSDFISDSKKEAASSHIVGLLGSDEAGQIIIEFSEDANNQIKAFRDSLIEPVEAARKAELRLLNQTYGDIIQAQDIITARLDAESKKDNITHQLYSGLLGQDRAARLFNRSEVYTGKTYDIFRNAPTLDDSDSFKQWSESLVNFFYKRAQERSSDKE